MKKFCELLREHSVKIINSKKRKMNLVTKEQQGSYGNAKMWYICKEKFENKYVKDKKRRKVGDHCHCTGEYRDALHYICNLKYSLLETIPIVFLNGSNYDCHFIIKEVAEELKKKYLFRRKNCKMHNLHSSNRKSGCKNWSKWRMYYKK